jgi:ADP-heptose:LPS heptosyltransferase
MAAGEARRLHEALGGKVKIIAWPGGDMCLSSRLWDNIDYIAQSGEVTVANVVDSPAHRPYRERFASHGSVWREYRPIPAEIRLTDHERAFAAFWGSDFVLIEPHVKIRRDGAANKQWGWSRYSKLVAELPEVRWCQVGRPDLELLPGVERIPTDSFRQACAVLARAAAYVGPEGALHHASAAFGIPGVVIFGGYISPKVTGYDIHTNLFSGSGLGCGNRDRCKCDCMARIRPASVARALRTILRLPDFPAY